MYTLKWIGDKTPPCLTPFVTENGLEVHPFSSLAAPEVVIRTTSGATSDEKVVNMATFCFHWRARGVCQSYLNKIRSPVDSPHKGQLHGALMFSLICVCSNGWSNNRDAGHLRHHRAHYDVTVMYEFVYFVDWPIIIEPLLLTAKHSQLGSNLHVLTLKHTKQNVTHRRGNHCNAF